MCALYPHPRALIESYHYLHLYHREVEPVLVNIEPIQNYAVMMRRFDDTSSDSEEQEPEVSRHYLL